MRLTLAFVMVLGMGCGSTEPTSPAPDPDTPVSSEPGGEEPPADPPPAGECAEGGWPRGDQMEGCDFVVEGCCYDDQAAACAAAGCAPDACSVLESYPAQIRCQ